jgi:superfamily II DNA/RNA helicase
MPEEIVGLCHKYMVDPLLIEITSEENMSQNIEQLWYPAENNQKLDLLTKIIYIENPEACIIFCRTQENVERLTEQMKDKKLSCSSLHGGMLQDDRLDVMERFRKGEFRFLVATDIAARGIDIENITHIINYDVPVENESYVHRIGRTGRAGHSGKAITFVYPGENGLLQGIEEYIGYSIPKGDIPSDEEVDRAKKAFKTKNKVSLAPKITKSEQLSGEITKIYINAGKKKKIRPGDIVGGITSIDGIEPTDIGIIDIQDNVSYIDILNGKGKLVLAALQYKTIKGKALRVERAQK